MPFVAQSRRTIDPGTDGEQCGVAGAYASDQNVLETHTLAETSPGYYEVGGCP